MRTQLGQVVTLLAITCAVPTTTSAQIGFPGDMGTSARPLILEGLDFASDAEIGGAGTDVTWMLGSSGRAGEDASLFSAFGGFSTAGTLIMEGALSYARISPEGLDGVNVVQGTVKVALPIKGLKRSKVTLALNGDAQWMEEIGQGYAARLIASRPLGKKVEVGGSVAYKGSLPETGDAIWAVVPALTASAVLLPRTSLRANYTFDNDVDGDDAYELVGAYRMQIRKAPPLQLRVGINQDADLSAGVVLFF